MMELIFGLFLSFILMSALKPLVNRMESKKVPRQLAAFLVLISAIGLIGFTLGFILPPIISESILFFKNLPFLLAKTFPFLQDYLKVESAIQFLPDLTQNVVKVVTGVFSNFLFLVSVFFFTFYFLLEEKFLEKFLSRFFEPRQTRKIVEVTEKIERRMGAWMRGEIVLMSVIGILTYVGLSILGVKYALSLAFIAGLLEVIPIIGPIISAIPAVLVATSTSYVLSGGTIILYIIIQQLENNIVVPFVLSKAVGMNPITTLIALTVGGTLGGLMGSILAVPAALFIETIVSETMKEKSS